MDTKIKNNIGPEEFGISASEAEKARNYAAFLVAEERKVCAKVGEDLANEIEQLRAVIQKLALTEPLAYINKKQCAVSFMTGEYGDDWVPVIERPNAEFSGWLKAVRLDRMVRGY